MLVDLDAPILSNRHISDEYNVIGLEAPEIASQTAPGQFVMIKTSRGFDPLLRRPFSVFEILAGHDARPLGISLLNKKVGLGTRLIFNVEPGDRMQCLGPLGLPFTVVDPPTRAWMIAGGVGLAPFVTLAESLRRRATPMTLFFGGRRAQDLFYLELFESLGVHLVVTTEDGTRGERGLVTRPLERALRATLADVPVMLYACGPTAMMHAIARLAVQHGRRLEVSLEQTMGCGLGGCYSCVVPVRDGEGAGRYVRSCIGGPVFDSRRIVWDGLQR